MQEQEQKNIICAEDAGPVVSVLTEEQEGKGRYSFLQKGDVYQFTVIDEVSEALCNAPSIIIGEVDSVTNKMIKLASWAYKKEPTVIRAASDIIAIECEDIALDDWYRFMDARLKSLSQTEKKNIGEEYTEEYKLIEHNFAKHIVEDITRGRVSMVHKPASKMSKDDKDRYFIYPKPSKIFMYSEGPFCEITEQIMKMVNNLENIPVVFGHDVIVDFLDYQVEVEKVRNNANKHIEQQFDEKNADELKSTKEALDALIGNEKAETPTALVFNDINVTVFGNAKEAAKYIDEDSEETFIIFNKKDDDTVLLTLTDDVQSILHSRKIIKKNKTIVVGPIKGDINGNIIELPLEL